MNRDGILELFFREATKVVSSLYIPIYIVTPSQNCVPSKALLTKI